MVDGADLVLLDRPPHGLRVGAVELEVRPPLPRRLRSGLQIRGDDPVGAVALPQGGDQLRSDLSEGSGDENPFHGGRILPGTGGAFSPRPGQARAPPEKGPDKLRLMDLHRFLGPAAVVCLLATTLPLQGTPPVHESHAFGDGHELPARPGPRVSGERPGGPTVGADPDTPSGRTRFLTEPAVLSVRSTAAGRPAFARSHVIVQFRDEVPEGRRERASRTAGARRYQPARWAAFARVTPGPGQSLDGLLAALRSDPDVAWAEPDPILQGHAGSVRSVTGANHIGDPFYPRQWNLERIRYHEALSLNGTQGAGVVVAVIDSGVASGSGARYPAHRGIDLETTTFLPGLDLVDGGPAHDVGITFTEPVSESIRFGHGTFAASQIAAGVNNGAAIAGIAPRVTILPVRVLGIDNLASGSNIAEAINYSVSAGADVINMSLGGSTRFEPIAQAVAAAHRSGVVVVASAGNEALDADAPDDVGFPARYPEVISVGATAFDGGRASYSNTGPGVEIMAPAGDDARLITPLIRDAALATSFVHDPVTGETTYGGFWATGTSFAAPQVAAAAALLKALGVRDPDVIRFLLFESARDLSGPGFDTETGHGLLDLLRAHQGLGFAS